MEKRALNEMYAALTDEQKEKISRCKTPEELTARLGEWGIELPDEALDGVAGGFLHFGGGSVKEPSWMNALQAPPKPKTVSLRPGV